MEPDDNGQPENEPQEVRRYEYGSLTSSVIGHSYQHGRRYHNYRQGRYPFPNDEEEHQREHLRHELYKELLEGKLFLAPIGHHPQNILDIGTGFGYWATAVGEAFPSAHVRGVDLSPVQSTWVLPNVSFIVDDIEDNWMLGSNYDFIHMRVVATFIKDPAKLFATALNALKPGGWIELQEMGASVGCDDDTVPADYPIRRLCQMMEDLFSRVYGFDANVALGLPALLAEAGFTGVQVRELPVPIGAWHHDLRQRTMGLYFKQILADMTEAVSAKPASDSGLPLAELEDMLEACRVALEDQRYHAYMPAHIVWAQRPVG